MNPELGPGCQNCRALHIEVASLNSNNLRSAWWRPGLIDFLSVIGIGLIVKHALGLVACAAGMDIRLQLCPILLLVRGINHKNLGFWHMNLRLRMLERILRRSPTHSRAMNACQKFFQEGSQMDHPSKRMLPILLLPGGLKTKATLKRLSNRNKLTRLCLQIEPNFYLFQHYALDQFYGNFDSPVPRVSVEWWLRQYVLTQSIRTG